MQFLNMLLKFRNIIFPELLLMAVSETIWLYILWNTSTWKQNQLIYPLWNQEYLWRCTPPLLHTHLFCQQFLLPQVSLVWTLYIKESTFCPHITQSLCTSSHFTKGSQGCNPEGQHLEFPTGRTGFSSYRKHQLQQKEDHS